MAYRKYARRHDRDHPKKRKQLRHHRATRGDQRVGVKPGDHVLVEIRPVDIRPRLIPELQRVADELVDRPETAEAFALLADN